MSNQLLRLSLGCFLAALLSFTAHGQTIDFVPGVVDVEAVQQATDSTLVSETLDVQPDAPDGLYIGEDELASPMMTDARVGTYGGSWWNKITDLYEESPVLFLLGLITAVYLLFFVYKKIAIALI